MPLCSLTVTYSDPGRTKQKLQHTAPYKQEYTNPFHNSHARIRDQRDSCHKKSSHALRLSWEDPQPLDYTWCKGSGRQRTKRQLCSCLVLLYSALGHIVLWQQSSLQLVLLTLKIVQVQPDRASSPTWRVKPFKPLCPVKRLKTETTASMQKSWKQANDTSTATVRKNISSHAKVSNKVKGILSGVSQLMWPLA